MRKEVKDYDSFFSLSSVKKEGTLEEVDTRRWRVQPQKKKGTPEEDSPEQQAKEQRKRERASKRLNWMYGYGIMGSTKSVFFYHKKGAMSGVFYLVSLQ